MTKLQFNVMLSVSPREAESIGDSGTQDTIERKMVRVLNNERSRGDFPVPVNAVEIRTRGAGQSPFVRVTIDGGVAEGGDIDGIVDGISDAFNESAMVSGNVSEWSVMAVRR